MKKLPIISAALALTTCIIAICWAQSRNDEGGKLKLQISSSPTAYVGFAPDISAFITYQGRGNITLVQPGEGSESGCRTPLVRTRIESMDTVEVLEPRYESDCKDLEPLKATDIFELKWGSGRRLEDRFFIKPFTKPGRYKITFYYENEPRLWRASTKGANDAGAMRRLQNSHACSLVSNELMLTVVKLPAQK